MKMDRTWIGLLCGAALVGCGGAEIDTSDQPLTYEEFRDVAFQDVETGLFIYNGDEIAEDELQLKTAYESYLDSHLFAQGIGRSKDALIVNRVSGRDDKWSSSAALNITYCVSSASFGSRYNTVVTAMTNAAGAWEGVSNVNFVHSSGSDGSCTRTTSGVVFNVRQVSGQPFLARSFFPSSSRRNREVLIDSSSFGSIAPYTLTGILRHELGHTLGFRHEHTRPESGACFEDNNWRALTAYDSASVMHYPQCNGSNTGNLVLTARDGTGAAALYP